MGIEFDPAKDAANIAKHGVSLARAANVEIHAVLPDPRFTGEVRYRAFGLLGDIPHCLAFTMRGPLMRAISLRRARAKEFKRYTARVS